MKRLIASLLVSTCTLLPCLADAKEDVKAAAKKLADAACYTWTATTEIEGGNYTPPVVTGKTVKDGFALVSSERDGTTTTAVLKGAKGVVKTDEGWKTAEDLRAAAGGGGGGGGRGMRGAQLLRTVLPADQAGKMADKAKELKSEGAAIGGDLTEEGAKELISFGRRPGGNAPEAKNAKGSVRYWLKDGQLTKVQFKVSGTITVNGEDRDMGRTTTYEIKDVGSTKVEVPEEAKKALGT